MNNKYALHDDYRKVPSFSFGYGHLQMGFFNSLLKLDRLRCRKPAPDMTRETRSFPGFDDHMLKALVMAPANLVKPAPVLLYYHGGAFSMTYAAGHVQMCERYAREVGCVVVLVDYRLMTKYLFPYGFNDCFSTLQWVIANATTLGIDPHRIAVMGDSAGGAMAAGVAQKAFDQHVPLRAQLLVYSVLDCDCKTASATDFTDVPMWTAISNSRMWQLYLKEFKGRSPKYASPTQRKNLAGLAPAYIDTAEFDPLRDEGIAYAQALQAQGVPVKLNATRGTIHGYELAQKNAETVRSLEGRVGFLRERFA